MRFTHTAVGETTRAYNDVKYNEGQNTTKFIS